MVNKYIYIYIIPLFFGGGGGEVCCFGVVIEFTSRPLICILDKDEGEKVENTSPIVFLIFKVYCH